MYYFCLSYIMRVSAAIPRGRPPGNPRATHGLSRGFVAKACPARGALERFCVFGKMPGAIPTGSARNLLSQRSAVFATGQASSLARCSSSPRGNIFLCTMVKYCAVALCHNGSKKRPDFSYFCFPTRPNERKKWEVFCKRADKKFKTLGDPRICSLHFKESDIEISISYG